MLKPALLFILSLLTAGIAAAQQKPYNPLKDTIVYLLKYPNTMVYSKQDADYFRIVTPPEPNTTEKSYQLYGIKEFYSDGRAKLLGTSLNFDLFLEFHGTRLEYYPDGHKKSIENFDQGNISGDAFKFYPNGKIYVTGKYVGDENFILDECADSSGKVLAEKGNGYWIKYDDDFKHIIGEGNVKGGLEDGEWHGILDDSLKYSCIYNNGKVISGKGPKGLSDSIYSVVDVQPSFTGGIGSFYNFLFRNIRYPAYSRDHNIQGRVFITFVIEKDGAVTHCKIIRGVSLDIDEEAIRVLKISPPWIPGTKNGKPVRTQYTMPINFALQVDKR